jgi:hypothetical protein
MASGVNVQAIGESFRKILTLPGFTGNPPLPKMRDILIDPPLGIKIGQQFTENEKEGLLLGYLSSKMGKLWNRGFPRP